MKIGLYFGTFNPIHIGHLVIANHLAEYSDFNQIWFVVTPQSPFKIKQSMLDNYQRLEMVYRATKEYDKLKPSDIEFNLPQPNYTVNTLAYLQEKYPKHEFSLIMGEDNLKGFTSGKTTSGFCSITKFMCIQDFLKVLLKPNLKIIQTSKK